MLDVYADSFAFVQYHVYDEAAMPWSNARWTFYGGGYTPTAIFDGTDRVAGAVHDIDQQYTVYRTNHLLPDRAIPTDVTLTVSAQSLGGATYRVSAQVGIEPGGASKTVRIYIVQVLDHWPASRPYHRNGFKQAAPAQDITLGAGESQVVQADFTFDADSWADPENIKIVAWAQAPVDAAPAEVYQAATRLWPLISLPGDADADGAPDATDNCPARYNPDQADADTDGVGDVCDTCVSVYNPAQIDRDEDRIGDVCDNCPTLHHVNQNDADADGVGDVCDSCPEVGAPGGVDLFGRSLGAIDLDCDVDLSDLARLADCIGGPGVTTPPPGCDAADFDRSDLNDDGDADLGDFAVFTVNFTGPLTSPPLYIGASQCAACHSDRHAQWAETLHATAFDRLVSGGQGGNSLCFPCHSAGYGHASGFVDLATTPHLAGVQCENCHGPGSNHAADPGGVPLPIEMDASLCGACHQSCHGLCGENHHPQFEQWSTSKHATALSDIQWAPGTEQACLQCHSTDYRLAPEGQKPDLYDALYDLECVACHSPHGGANAGQLRLPPNQLCAECHTMADAGPGDEPEQPQTEMLHGSGGYALDGTPLNGPYTQHWWGIPDECAVCHVHEEPYGGPQQPVNSGHTFEANLRACQPCHSEATATMLVNSLHEEIDGRLAMIAPYFDPGDPLYIDPSGLSPPERAQYDIARFNRDLVQADRSSGSHNAEYARALLTQTETFLGIPPWGYRCGDPGPGGGSGAATRGGMGQGEVG